MKKNAIVSIMCIAVLLVLSACGDNKPVSTEQKLTHVKVVPVKKETLEKTETYNGQIKASKEVTITNKYSGEVEKVNFDIGDKVKKGDVLYTLKTTTTRNNLNQLSSQLSSTQAAVNISKTSLEMAQGSSKEDAINQSQNALSAAKSGLAQVEIQYDDAKRNLERVKQLYSSGAASKQQLEQAELVYKSTETSIGSTKVSLDTAQKTYNLLVSTKLEQSVTMATHQLSQAEASLQALRAQYENAVEALDDMTVESPIEGYVSMRNIEVGENIGPSPVFTLVDTDSVWMDINIPEKSIQKIILDQKVKVTLSSIPGKTFEAFVKNISPSATAGNLTYPVRLEMPNKDSLLKAGLYAEANITVDRSEGALVLPRKCIFNDAQKKSVFVLENGAVSLVEVTLGIGNDTEIEIKSGLKEGQQVVEKGMDYITNGQKVTEVK